MCSQIVIRASGVTKGFSSYEVPADRLKQGVLSAASRVLPNSTARQLVREKSEKYGRTFWALNGVSFEVAKGETIGVIGRNGSGKSTLLQIVCQTLNPTNGSVEVTGRVAALLELGSGFDLEYTGRENIYLNGQLHGLTRRQIDERLADIIAFADIGDFIDQPVKTYSSGMFVRLAFAVIAHVDADILVVDEALAVGDAFFNQKCLRFMDRFRESGTILFVSHDTSTVKKLCTRVIWIDKGVVMRAGDADEVCEAYLDAYYEAGPVSAPSEPAAAPASGAPCSLVLEARRDSRLSMVNHSKYRNDIEVLPFEPTSASFGRGDARIVGVELVDEGGSSLAWVVGGEPVTLRVTVQIRSEIESAIVGFFFNDSLGQPLFGDNTYQTYRNRPVSCIEGDILVARFTFAMPIVPTGNYSINVAVADGTQQRHVQLHWIHDALPVKVHTSSTAHHLLAIPMLRVGVTTSSAVR
ncbi:lipopolysaccharide transport system ATP-binding protein [Paraburkholderia sp. BL6669N2]|uniref:ABC transporter ATP-binding protein n=1 Tax=Paraburkholderia sp. BL6669N2 TaxID=1938807 RepID=UPI000E238EDE|nr:ABC transporter ATP-binding protein [Paraburkholderia sp. BL6669N2]REG61254.1 lipopolysaccharide transport system ATP-binding protein [Paraburkholderia sp. BL6669N2]